MEYFECEFKEEPNLTYFLRTIGADSVEEFSWNIIKCFPLWDISDYI